MAITYIKDNEYKDQISKEGITVVNFYADWCGPCQMFAKELEALDAEGQVKIVKLNVDENQVAASEANVKGIPASYIYKDGELVKLFAGYKTLVDVKTELDKLK